METVISYIAPDYKMVMSIEFGRMRKCCGLFNVQ